MSRSICIVFEALGYKVNNRNGKENLILNILDLSLFFGYLGLSIYNLNTANPTYIGFVLNFLILLRLFLKNIIEQCKVTKSMRNYGNFTLVHMIKIVMEICIILFIATAYIAFYDINAVYRPNFMKFYIGVILVVTSFENVLAFGERIYDAEPRVIQYAK